ncbi:hypothetical protein [Alteromonas flava]|uniref:hypothetical protein n=1 Tax=Alteromonas flava TaxID=2048003 RepID=UPI000C28CC81|nr:hypothetical protein [Alteromonas flava]
MPRITIALSNPALSGSFETRNDQNNTIARTDRSLSHSYEAETGKTYRTAIAVTGPEGTKYKIKVTGASSAVYPTGEQTLDDNLDHFVVRTTG